MRLFALLGLALVAAANAGAAAPARLQVTENEYHLLLSRLTLHPGSADVQLVNFGQDPHDLVIQPQGKTKGKTVTVPVVAPGDRRELTLKLVPGRYILYCSLADHRARGMWAPLVVR